MKTPSPNLLVTSFLLLIFLIWLQDLRSQNTEIMYLSGTGSDQTVDWEFFCTEGRNAGKWTNIPVPSCWEQMGFGSYNYGYDKAENRAKEKGLYKYSFSIPKNWKDKQINIVFEGSMTDTEVKINGKNAGPIHQGAFYRFKYNITPLLHFEKENLLEVTVSKVSSNESVNKAERNADYWVFGGIFRPVYLEALPKNHLKRVAVDARANGELLLQIQLPNNHKASVVEAQLINPRGIAEGEILQVNVKNKTNAALNTRFENVQLWSPEFPNLYALKVTLVKDGIIQHFITEKVGFRTIEIRKRDGVYLNGVKIKFKGVNRHSFWPETGRTLSNAQILSDALLIKNMNMNAVRNSHYPADPYFYQVCDSLGIMVLDELGGWHDAYDTETGAQLVMEMVEKSMNHPSVVMWVNGNEGGHNRDLLPLYQKLDIQNRPVIQAWEIFNNIDTQHYRDYNYGVGSHYQGHEVVMPAEFLHGLYDGGHGAGLQDFWELMWNNPLSAGGFLWVFADEAVIRTDKNGMLDSDGNHGADGILGPFHEKEGSYFTIKEVWSPLFFQHREITENFNGKLILENRYHFTNTNQCTFSFALKKLAPPNNQNTDDEIKGEIDSPVIIPGKIDTLKIHLPENWHIFDVLYITAKDPHGMGIYTWSWPISYPKDIANSVVDTRGNQNLSIEENDTNILALAGKLKLTFNKQNGLLQQVKNENGEISFNNGPVLCEGITDFKELGFEIKQDKLLINSTFGDKSSYKKVAWTIYPSGWVQLDVEYCPETERSELMGITFSYPEHKVEGIQWMGKGPYRVWKNRIKGSTLGVWDKAYNNTITGQSEYIYPEFKGYHANMYWLKIKTSEQDFMVVTENEDLFFHMFTPPAPDDPYNTAPLFPSGDISFMHGITPIGTKSLQTFRMGPMSEKNIFYTYNKARCKSMRLYFDFRGE